MNEAEHIFEIQKAFLLGDFPVDVLKKEYVRHWNILRKMKVDMSVESNFRVQLGYKNILMKKILLHEPEINFGELEE